MQAFRRLITSPDSQSINRSINPSIDKGFLSGTDKSRTVFYTKVCICVQVECSRQKYTVRANKLDIVCFDVEK